MPQASSPPAVAKVVIETKDSGPNASTPPLHRGMLEGILSDVVLEFFDSYGVPCSPRRALDAESGEAGTELGSMISIRGGKTHGGLAFVAPMGLVASLIPVPHRSESPEMAARDWCLEMANQLLGRLKNKLAAYSLTFDIGTPVCFSGRSIRLVFLPDAEGVALTFIVASHEFRVYLDWSFETGALPVKSGRIRIAAEGEVFLF